MGIEAALQVNAALFRAQAPDLLLRPGQELAARVMERNGRHGMLNLAGVPIVAELPDEVQTGDKLRLLVADTRGEKVVMKLVQEQAGQAPPPPLAGLPLPGGGAVRIEVDPDSGNEGRSGSDPEHASIAITYDSPALGPIGFRLSLAPGAVQVQAEVRAGAPYELADDASDALSRRLAAVTGREAHVSVLPRRESIDAYA